MLARLLRVADPRSKMRFPQTIYAHCALEPRGWGERTREPFVRPRLARYARPTAWECRFHGQNSCPNRASAQAS